MFQCLLADAGGARVLDFHPDPDSADACGFEGMNEFLPDTSPRCIRSRWCWRSLTTSGLTASWPPTQISIQHEREELISLTAGSAEPCDFVASLAPMEGAFSDGDPLYRDGSMPAPSRR